jgi:hypothetical protein
VGRTAMKLTVKAKKNGMLKSGSSRRQLCRSSEKGIALAAVVVFTLILTILGFSVLIVANNEVASTRKDINRTKAFYLAEAGVEVFSSNLNRGVYGNIGETEFGEGSYHVDFNTATDPPIAIATGSTGGQEKRIQVTASFLAPPYECGIYAGGHGGINWSLLLRGKGNPTVKKDSFGKEIGNYGGKDTINGNIFVDGDVYLYEQSRVDPPLGDNPFGLKGDVTATGDVNVDTMAGAAVAGDINEHADPMTSPDLIGMNYALNNTHNVSQIFADAGVTHGELPTGNELRDVFQINPNNMTTECATTSGDDYFLTPTSNFTEGNWKTAPTPLNIGEGRIYYINGDLWIHSKSTFGFTLSGNSTIVVTGNIHLCDNTVYTDSNSDMLGLVALGKYDEDGDLESGGNVYYGDPTTGTLYTCSAMMFAANDFLYNSMAIDTFEAEPESGFVINGNISALNHVSIERDWYTKYTYQYGYNPKTWKWEYYWVKTGVGPANYKYDPVDQRWEWIDSVTGVELTDIEINGDASTNREAMRHYQMVINYDDRVRSRDTQPPGLPRGVGVIFEKLSNWEELP